MTCIFSARDDLDRNCPTSNHISDASPEKRKSKWAPKCNATVHQPEPKPLRFIQFYKKSRYLECIFSARDDLRDLKCNSVHRIEQTPTQVGPNSLIFRLSWRVLSKNRRKVRSTTFQCRYDRTGGCRVVECDKERQIIHPTSISDWMVTFWDAKTSEIVRIRPRLATP